MKHDQGTLQARYDWMYKVGVQFPSFLPPNMLEVTHRR